MLPCASSLVASTSLPTWLPGEALSAMPAMLDLAWSLVPSASALSSRAICTDTSRNHCNPHNHCNPRSLAMACVGCLNKAMARSLAKRRARHAHCRLQQLKRTLPELPTDVLDQCNLRQLSYAIKRCGGPCQLMLRDTGVDKAYDETSCATPPSLPCGPGPDRLEEQGSQVQWLPR